MIAATSDPGLTRVLMIDDDKKLCRLVTTYLEPLGFVVSVFAIQLEENAGAMIFRHLMVGCIKKSYFPGWNAA